MCLCVLAGGGGGSVLFYRMLLIHTCTCMYIYIKYLCQHDMKEINEY